MTKELGIRHPGKISAKTLGFNQQYLTKLIVDDKPGTVRDLFVVTGDITGKKTGNHAEYGPWTKFIGNFAATDREGVINRAPELLLPNVISPIIEAQLDTGKKQDIENGTQNFECITIEFEITVERTERSYKFGCQNLNVKAAQDDPMVQRLMNLKKENKKISSSKTK